MSQNVMQLFLKIKEKKVWNSCPFFPGIAEEKIANCYLLLENAEEKI